MASCAVSRAHGIGELARAAEFRDERARGALCVGGGQKASRVPLPPTRPRRANDANDRSCAASMLDSRASARRAECVRTAAAGSRVADFSAKMAGIPRARDSALAA